MWILWNRLDEGEYNSAKNCMYVHKIKENLQLKPYIYMAVPSFSTVMHVWAAQLQYIPIIPRTDFFPSLQRAAAVRISLSTSSSCTAYRTSVSPCGENRDNNFLLLIFKNGVLWIKAMFVEYSIPPNIDIIRINSMCQNT